MDTKLDHWKYLREIQIWIVYNYKLAARASSLYRLIMELTLYKNKYLHYHKLGSENSCLCAGLNGLEKSKQTFLKLRFKNLMY